MIKHQETHPDLDVEGCFGCKVSAVGFSAELMPTRTGSSRSATIAQKDRVLEKDLDAYKRLRQHESSKKTWLKLLLGKEKKARTLLAV
jgi:hypothetical protein